MCRTHVAHAQSQGHKIKIQGHKVKYQTLSMTLVRSGIVLVCPFPFVMHNEKIALLSTLNSKRTFYLVYTHVLLCFIFQIFQAIQFLHDLGSVQHFSNEYLKSHVVINPQWIVDVMACVVSVKNDFIKVCDQLLIK